MSRPWPAPGRWSATPARPPRACATWRSTRSAAAAGPTTAWACTTPCWSRTTTSRPRGACAGRSRRPGRPAPGCPWRSRWRPSTRSPRPSTSAATCCCWTTWTWGRWPGRVPPAAGGPAPRRRAGAPWSGPGRWPRPGSTSWPSAPSPTRPRPWTSRLIGGPMLLAVDVGNTEITIGVFEGQELAQHWRAATVAERTADEHALLLGGFLAQEGLSLADADGVVVSSVVPRLTQALREMIRRYCQVEPLIVEPGVRTGLPILTDNPREVGADRVVNAIAAYAASHGGPVGVVDFGTATTFDAVSERGEHLGAAIAPGIQISMNALVERTAQLRRVELVTPRSVIGKNTVESLQAGAIWGFAGQVDGGVRRPRRRRAGPAPRPLAPPPRPADHLGQKSGPWLSGCRGRTGSRGGPCRRGRSGRSGSRPSSWA